MDEHTEHGPPLRFGPDDDEATDDALDRAYADSLARYYRFVLRKEDGELLKRILKIPDDWREYERTHASGVAISDRQKKRLSDLKKTKASELAFESRYIFGLIMIENALLACLQYHANGAAMVDDAIESARDILDGAAGGSLNFKYLLLSLAKRSISDLYYLMVSYQKFYHKKCFDFEADFNSLVENISATIAAYRTIPDRLRGFLKYRDTLSPFFTRSSTFTGQRLNEITLKRQVESGEVSLNVEHLEIVIPALDSYRQDLRRNHDFIAYYYNRNDGKLYRYDFILLALTHKLASGRLDDEIHRSFESVRDSFLAIKTRFEIKGLAGFGPPEFDYLSAVELTYECCKVLEFLYLRGGLYEKLQDMRGRILTHAEQELHRLIQYR